MNNPLLNTIKIIFPVGIIILLAGCKTISMKKADEAMQLKNYAISADMYDQLASNTKLTKDVRQTAAYRGAESYRYNHQPKKAHLYFLYCLLKSQVHFLFYALFLQENHQ